MKYERRIVAFIDILGFEKAVNETVDKKGKHDDRRIEEIEKALYEVKKMIEPNPSWHHTLTYGRGAKDSSVSTQFSDSIVASLLAEKPRQIFEKLETLYWIPITLIRKARLMCRGGVAHGYAFHTKDTLFGPAVNQAFRLEQSAAFYPRIVIHPDVYSFLESARNEIESVPQGTKIEDILTQDADGFYYIDYFKRLSGRFEGSEWSEYCENLKLVIKDGLKSSEPGILAKSKWMQSRMQKLGT